MKGSKKARTFLALEDDANDAILIHRALTNESCQAFVCRNTSEARAYLLGAGMYADRARYPFPDVFVTDLRLGDESGVHFFQWLRSDDRFKDLPVIVLSGVLNPNEVRTLKQLGAARIYHKPSELTELYDVFAEILEKFGSPK